MNRVPTVGGKALDLHHLFVEVTSRGGIEKVWVVNFFIFCLGAFCKCKTVTKYAALLIFCFTSSSHNWMKDSIKCEFSGEMTCLNNLLCKPHINVELISVFGVILSFVGSTVKFFQGHSSSSSSSSGFNFSWNGYRSLQIVNGRKWLQPSISQLQLPVHHLS